jgi:hypothetical protein
MSCPHPTLPKAHGSQVVDSRSSTFIVGFKVVYKHATCNVCFNYSMGIHHGIPHNLNFRICFKVQLTCASNNLNPSEGDARKPPLDLLLPCTNPNLYIMTPIKRFHMETKGKENKLEF